MDGADHGIFMVAIFDSGRAFCPRLGIHNSLYVEESTTNGCPNKSGDQEKIFLSCNFSELLMGRNDGAHIQCGQVEYQNTNAHRFGKLHCITTAELG